MTPAMIGPIACISSMFRGSDSCPTLFTTRAAMGTALTQRLDQRIDLLLAHLVHQLRQQYARSRTDVEGDETQRQDAEGLRGEELVGRQLEPTARPRRMVTMLISLLRAAPARRLATPLTASRLPKHNALISGVASGSSRMHRPCTSRGKRCARCA